MASPKKSNRTKKPKRSNKPATSRTAKAQPAAKNRSRLRFHSKLYPAKAIKEASQAFEHLVKVRITRKGTHREVTLIPVSDSLPDSLEEEFCNYALSRAVFLR